MEPLCHRRTIAALYAAREGETLTGTGAQALRATRKLEFRACDIDDYLTKFDSGETMVIFVDDRVLINEVWQSEMNVILVAGITAVNQIDDTAWLVTIDIVAAHDPDLQELAPVQVTLRGDGTGTLLLP